MFKLNAQNLIKVALLHGAVFSGVYASGVEKLEGGSASLASNFASAEVSSLVRPNRTTLSVVPRRQDLPKLPARTGQLVSDFDSYKLERTSDLYNKAIVPKTDELRDEWRNKLEFLHTVLESAITVDVRSLRATGEAVMDAKLIDMFNLLYILRHALKNYGFVPEKELHVLYTEVAQILTHPDYSEFARGIYAPLKLWIEDNLPVGEICQDIEIKYDARYQYMLTFSKKHFRRRMHDELVDKNLGLYSVAFDTLLEKIVLVVDDIVLRYENDPVLDVSVPVLMRFVLAELDVRQAIDAEIELALSEAKKVQARVAKRNTTEASAVSSMSEAELAAAQADADKAMLELLAELGDEPSSGSKKGKKRSKKKKNQAKGRPSAEASKLESVALQDGDALAALEEQRVANLEATKKQRAARKRRQDDRQAKLRERREFAQKEQDEMYARLKHRAQTNIDEAFLVYSRLKDVGVIDPSIFEGTPKLSEVAAALEAAGVSVSMHIHGNEKCLAMWKDYEGKKHMVWFDAPHGAQLRKGAKAGWVRALKSKLQETGMLGGA